MFKKAIFPLVLVVVAITSPVLAMSASPTRSLLFNLAPQEAVLTLADQIDQNRAEAEKKVIELQSLVEAQSQSLNTYEAKFVEQEARISKQEQALNVQTAVAASQAQVQQSLGVKLETQTKCQQLYSENVYCGNKVYKTKEAFDEYYKDSEMKDSAKKKYEKCQEIIKTCGY